MTRRVGFSFTDCCLDYNERLESDLQPAANARVFTRRPQVRHRAAGQLAYASDETSRSRESESEREWEWGGASASHSNG